ncbi:MAG: dTDP-4-dehydrorhamnose 3,5-epimerase [Desulfovibrionaceae bacterium]
MNVLTTPLEGLLIFQPKVFQDERGFFLENFRSSIMEEYAIPNLVQWNHSRSVRGVLRGIHHQSKEQQGKLVSIMSGSIYDVAVDLRKNSPTYTKWYGRILNDSTHEQLWIPEGFGHAFYTLSETADVFYACSRYYMAKHQRSIHYQDPTIQITWPLCSEPILSEQDSHAPFL